MAILCSLHHGEAHTQRRLEQNLTGSHIARIKAIWEEQIRRDDATAIQEGTVLQAETWFYFNHLRLYELALELGVDALPGLTEAVAADICRPDGTVSKAAAVGSYMYADSDRALLFRFMFGLLRAVLADAPLRNISDYLDRGVLDCLIPGDMVFVQGLHTFTPQSPAPAGSQLSRGRRSANRVVVSFMFDLSEATSSSAWSTWLLGTGNVGCLLRVQRLSRLGLKLHIECTVLAIRSSYGKLKQRIYERHLLESGLPLRNEEHDEQDSSMFDEDEQRVDQ